LNTIGRTIPEILLYYCPFIGEKNGMGAKNEVGVG
jgi:hypothetical protein